MISSVRQYQVLGHKKLCSLRDNYSFSYLFARWIERCNLDENWRNTTGVDGAVAAIFWKVHRTFFKNMKQSKKRKTQKSVVFGSVNTILQAKQGYLCCGWNNRNSQRTMSFKVVEQELRQLVTALHLKISLEQMYTMPSLVVLFEQECKQSC